MITRQPEYRTSPPQTGSTSRKRFVKYAVLNSAEWSIGPAYA